MAEPFHCDFTKRLFLGHLGNHLLNAADFHSDERHFGMTTLNPGHMTWVLSRLAIEMDEMPAQYDRFEVETWVESAMRSFTNRNFRIASAGGDGRVYGYGRSVWALIDTGTRQPVNLEQLHGGGIMRYVEAGKPCPIGPLSRVKMGRDVPLVATVPTAYSDIDVNGHVNSVKYIEHVLDLFDLEWHEGHFIRRLDIAYVAESHHGDTLQMYMEQAAGDGYNVRITKRQPSAAGETEVCRVALKVAARSKE